MENKLELKRLELKRLVGGALIRDIQGDVYMYTGESKDLDVTAYLDVDGMPIINDVKNLERLLGNDCFSLIYTSENIGEIKEQNKRLKAQVEILQDTIKKLKGEI